MKIFTNERAYVHAIYFVSVFTTTYHMEQNETQTMALNLKLCFYKSACAIAKSLLYFTLESTVRMKKLEQCYINIEIATKINCWVIERDLSHRVKGPTFLSLTAGRQVSESYLTRTITGSKSLGKSFGTTLWHQVQRCCFLGIYFVHAQCRWDWFFSVYVGKISAWGHLKTKHLLVSDVSIWG